MTDQVLSRAAIVASLATNTDGNITAQTLRNWLMSSPLNTECVLLTGGSTIAGSVTATTFALGNGANFIASTGGFEAGGVLVQNNTNPIFQVDGGGNVTFYGGVSNLSLTNDLQMGGYAIDDCASFNCANIGGTGPSLSPTALNMEGKPIQYVSSLNNGGSGINFSTETLTGIAAINVAGTNTLAPTGVTTTGFTDSGSTAIHLASTYKGSTGTTAYTIGDIVTVLKTVGLLKP